MDFWTHTLDAHGYHRNFYCGHGAHDNLLSSTIKWTGLMLQKQRFTADLRISQKGVEVKVKLGLIKPGGISSF